MFSAVCSHMQERGVHAASALESKAPLQIPKVLEVLTLKRPAAVAPKRRYGAPRRRKAGLLPPYKAGAANESASAHARDWEAPLVSLTKPDQGSQNTCIH